MKPEILETVYLEVESIVLRGRGYLYGSDILGAFIKAKNQSINDYEKHLIEIEIGFWRGTWKKEGWTREGDFGSLELSQLTEDDLLYFERRISLCQSHLLRAKYAHFSWQCKKSSYGLAALAVEEYLKYAIILAGRVSKDDEGYPALDLVDVLCRAFCLAIIGAKDQIDKVKSVIIECCTSQQGSGTLLITVKLSEFILEQKKFFKKDDYSAILERLWELVSNQEIGEYETLTQTAFDLGFRISEKCKNQQQPNVNWKLELGEYMLRLAKSREFHTGDTLFLHKAIKAFQDAGALDRASTAKLIFEEARKEIKLSVHTVEFSEHQQAKMSAERQMILDEVAKLAEKGGRRVLQTLAFDKIMIPSITHLKQQMQQEQFLGSKLFTPTQLDSRGNIVGIYVTDEEKMHHDLVQVYSMNLQLGYADFITAHVIESVRLRKLNAESCLQFLRVATWLDEKFDMPDLVGGVRQEHWLPLIEPAIRSFFADLESYILEEKPYYPPILFIDSIAIKLEGMIRRLFTNAGIATVKTNREKQQVQDINDLLHHDEIDKIFDEDTTFFLRFVLIDKGGFNLRHEVAHGLLSLEQYKSYDKAMLLFLALLRVGGSQI